MRSPRAREHTPAARSTLRRVRRVMTVVFTATNALGLLLLTVLAVRLDASRGQQQLDGELRRVTLAAIQRIDDQGGAVSLANLDGSGLTRECPSFAVLPGSAPAFLGLQSSATCPSASLPTLNDYATRATRANRVVTGYASSGGTQLRLLAEPFTRGRAVAGAVVAVLDAGPEQHRHQRLVLVIAIALTVIIGALAAMGHRVSGRAMRPAAATLDQQERFLAESAHDLRTPLAAMRALAETALDNPPLRDELLPRTVALTVRMGGLVDDLLMRARVAAGVEDVRRQPVRLDQLVAGVVESTPAGPGRLTFTGTESTVSADPNLIQRAVGNLIDNALRYGHQPGAASDVAVSVAGGAVTVADHGPGMQAPLDAARFDGVAAGSSTSSGLGLSIVRWIAQAHGGTLTVADVEGGGAAFTLTVPVSPPSRG